MFLLDWSPAGDFLLRLKSDLFSIWTQQSPQTPWCIGYAFDVFAPYGLCDMVRRKVYVWHRDPMKAYGGRLAEPYYFFSWNLIEKLIVL